GGDGIVRELAFDEPATLSLMGERRRHGPWGLAGGEPGAPGEDWLIRRDGSRERLPAKTTVEVEPGDRLLILTPGGGGWGSCAQNGAWNATVDFLVTQKTDDQARAADGENGAWSTTASRWRDNQPPAAARSAASKRPAGGPEALAIGLA